MAKKRVYVETSILSYLTARPAKDELKRVCQRLTAMWWERRSNWECFLTSTVLEEIGHGDPEAAARRLEKAKFLEESSSVRSEFLSRFVESSSTGAGKSNNGCCTFGNGGNSWSRLFVDMESETFGQS
ncbi:MAG: hypothetical protein FWD61_15135 [Phycisphaerales bacterium]|nr:hypothetical protein [Phycisphaerales bacterium]